MKRGRCQSAPRRKKAFLTLAALAVLSAAAFFFPRETSAKVTVYTRDGDSGNIVENGDGALEYVKGYGKLVIDEDVKGFEQDLTAQKAEGSSGFFEADITSVSVSKKNRYFTSIDGVLYDKTASTLIYYPCEKRGESFSLPPSVKKIREFAFCNNAYLKEVVLNEGLETIGAYAFKSSCIESIDIPSTTRVIEEGAFHSSRIKSAIVPSSVEEIGPYCFCGCAALSEIDNEARVSVIEEGTFGGCGSLKKLDIGDETAEIDDYAFDMCGARFSASDANKCYKTADGVLFTKDMKKLVRYPGLKGGGYTIPSSVEEIGRYAFTGCLSLNALTLNDSLREFPLSCLDGCGALETLNLSRELESLGASSYLAYGLASIRNINIAEQNKHFKIYDNALYSSDFRELLLIPNGRKSLDVHKNTAEIINKYCANNFEKITVSAENTHFRSYGGVLYNKKMTSLKLFPGSLVSYELPASLKNAELITSFGRYYDSEYYRHMYIELAPNLKKITVDEDNSYYKSEDGVLFDAEMEKIYKFPCAKKGAYKIPDGVMILGDDVFGGARNLTKLTTPRDMQFIDLVVQDCVSLKKIVVSEGTDWVRLWGASQDVCEHELYYSLTMSHHSNLAIEDVSLPSTLYRFKAQWINEDASFHLYSNARTKKLKQKLAYRGYKHIESRGKTPGKVKGLSYSTKDDRVYKLFWKRMKSADGYVVFTCPYITKDHASNEVRKTVKIIKTNKVTSLKIKRKKGNKGARQFLNFYVCAYKKVGNKRVCGIKRHIVIGALPLA